MKPQRKIAGGRKSEQHLNHPQPTPSPVQSAVGSGRQESDAIATNKHARIDHQLSKQSCLRGMSHHTQTHIHP